MLKTDSRKIMSGDTFLALRGVDHDGHDYINSAIEKGASKIICEQGNYSVPTEIVKDTRKYLEDYLYNNYYNQIKDIKLIGVTGTSGKTTTCYLVYQMLKLLNKKVAYIGTIGFYIDDKIMDLNNTTPDIDLLYEMFLKCYDSKVEYIVMEVSSQAIDMNRIPGLLFDEVAFTNLSKEHLDYHKTMDNYALSKQKLFLLLRNDKIAIVNNDNEYANMFLLKDNHNIKISFNKGDLTVTNYEMTSQGINISFNYNDSNYHTRIQMVGKYNIYNYLMALLLVTNLGFKIEDIIALNHDLKSPKGRMEMIAYKTNSIFVDYAHKPDAVSNVLESTKEYSTGKIITIIGCGGNRDKTKRPVMGQLATNYSSYVIFTNDNPRDEDEKDIMNDILKGVTENNYEVIYDRVEAIHKGIDLLTNNDILLILGKGHEDYQIIKGVKYHLDDKEIVTEYIKTKI